MLTVAENAAVGAVTCGALSCQMSVCGEPRSRNVTFAEDASTVHAGTAPRAMATLRNLAIGVLKALGADNIAKTTRTICDEPQRALPILGIAKIRTATELDQALGIRSCRSGRIVVSAKNSINAWLSTLDVQDAKTGSSMLVRGLLETECGAGGSVRVCCSGDCGRVGA
ncbi:hypothetical protein [Streptomyces sp. NPDC048386]|uniref:hypothetical protein n=1 Tax=Streptomyces sp. NPDC048386 TaxID=3365541 RepID=UPI00371AD407